MDRKMNNLILSIKGCRNYYLFKFFWTNPLFKIFRLIITKSSIYQIGNHPIKTFESNLATQFFKFRRMKYIIFNNLF